MTTVLSLFSKAEMNGIVVPELLLTEKLFPTEVWSIVVEKANFKIGVTLML